MVIVSCSVKLHAFALAEQLERKSKLEAFYTSYASGKNNWAKRLVKREDKEQIPVSKIHTIFWLAVLVKLRPASVHKWNDLFDKWVAHRLAKQSAKVFIGWSGMSLYSLRAAKRAGMVTILERGSSHIVYQDNILKEEYKRFGIDFSVHPQVVEKELQEYKEADYISVPSDFVRDSFITQGVPAQKLILNPYGAGRFFKPAAPGSMPVKDKFRIVYLGTLSVRKGLLYLFEALNMLAMPVNNWEIWFIGNIEEEIQALVDQMAKPNWIFKGKIGHYHLSEYLAQCDLGVQPSLEEGLSMVIPQMMSCGLPVIATTNTGGSNIIDENVNGYIVPIRSPAVIAEKITQLYAQPAQLEAMKAAAVTAIQSGFTWNDYGDRYTATLDKLTKSGHTYE